MSYKFVRIHKKNSDEYGTWFLKPRSIQDIEDHWKEICGSEMRKTVRERFENAVVLDNGDIHYPHPTTDFGMGVESYCNLMNMSYVIGLIEIENQAYRTRLSSFLKGEDIYLKEGMTVVVIDNRFSEIVEEVEQDTLTYPTKKDWNIDDVRYMQWNMLGNKGEHWYAKIGKRDIYDKLGNIKWNTKEQAQNAAEWFIKEKLNK